MSVGLRVTRVLKHNAALALIFGVCLLGCPSTIAGDKEGEPVAKGAKAAVESEHGPVSGKGAQLVAVKPRLVDVGAVWCLPCKQLNPILDKLKTSWGSKVDFEKLDFDKKDGKAFCDKYSIDGVPGIVIFDNHGKISYKHSGLVEEPLLTKELTKVAH